MHEPPPGRQVRRRDGAARARRHGTGSSQDAYQQCPEDASRDLRGVRPHRPPRTARWRSGPPPPSSSSSTFPSTPARRRRCSPQLAGAEARRALSSKRDPSGTTRLHGRRPLQRRGGHSHPTPPRTRGARRVAPDTRALPPLSDTPRLAPPEPGEAVGESISASALSGRDAFHRRQCWPRASSRVQEVGGGAGVDPGRVVARRRHPGHLRAGGREAGPPPSPPPREAPIRSAGRHGRSRIAEETHPRTPPRPRHLPKGRGLEPESCGAGDRSRCGCPPLRPGPRRRRSPLPLHCPEGRALASTMGPPSSFSSFSRPRRNVQGAPLARRISLEAHVQQRGPCPRGPVGTPPTRAARASPRSPQDQGFAQSGSPPPPPCRRPPTRPAPEGSRLVRAETAPLPPGPRAEHAATLTSTTALSSADTNPPRAAVDPKDCPPTRVAETPST